MRTGTSLKYHNGYTGTQINGTQIRISYTHGFFFIKNQ